jgi:hypothetical protein
MGKSIAAFVLANHKLFVETPAFGKPLNTYPVFGADVALNHQRSKLCRLHALYKVKCRSCSNDLVVDFVASRDDGRSEFYCSWCSGYKRCPAAISLAKSRDSNGGRVALGAFASTIVAGTSS